MSDVGRPAPEVYRLSIEKLPLAVGHARRLELLKVFVAATALTGFLTALTSTPHDALDAALIVGGLAVVALPYILWRAGRRVRRYWNAFELAIGGDTVRVAAKGEGRVTIRHPEIAEIVEGASGVFVRSVEPGVVVHVPSTVEGYGDVRSRLAALRPITAKPEAFPWSAGLLLGGVLVAAVVSRPQVALGLAVDLWLCQAAAAVFVAGELRGNRRLTGGARALAAVVALGAAVLPVVGLLRR